MSMQALRLAVAAKLQVDLGIPFVSGRLTGPQLEGDLGCSWPVREAEMEDAVDLEELEIGVRVFKQLDQAVALEAPFDPALLEALVVSMKQSLETIQVGAGGTWSFRLTDASYDLDQQAVEVTIYGVEWNQFSQVLD